MRRRACEKDRAGRDEAFSSENTTNWRAFIELHMQPSRERLQLKYSLLPPWRSLHLRREDQTQVLEDRENTKISPGLANVGLFSPSIDLSG